MYVRFLRIVILVFITICQACNTVSEENKIDLSGEWAFQVDSLDTGVSVKVNCLYQVLTF